MNVLRHRTTDCGAFRRGALHSITRACSASFRTQLRCLSTQQGPSKGFLAREVRYVSTRQSQSPGSKIPKVRATPSNSKAPSKSSAHSPTPPILEGAARLAAYDSQEKPVFPERLLIYHAGTGKTVFLSMVKLTSIFIFIYGALLVAPGYYYSPLESTWKAPATLALSAVPLLLMTVTTPPFVTFVHLTLPIWARASSARLHRYAQAIPSTAELDVTTMRWIWPRVTHLRISELHIDANAIGAMTIKREVPEALKQRPWWTWRPLKSFYVAGKSAGKIPERGVWDETLQCIVRGWDKPGLRGKMFVR